MLFKPKLTSLSSADTVAANDDLLTQILLRLPVRPLLRFKSVSKHWFSLITNPHFSLLRQHRNTNTAPSGLFLHRSSLIINPEFDFVPFHTHKPPPFRRLTFVDDPLGIKILQSCNGLLCCCTSRRLNARCNYYIYNPTTNRFFNIPEPNHRIFRITRGIASVCAVNLAFDPSKSPHYKALFVYISPSLPDNYFEIEIYSSETGLWKRAAGGPFFADVNFRLGVFWNGAVNWTSVWGDSMYSFDVDEERVGVIPMPPIPDGWEEMRRMRYFGESGGHLHLVEIYGPRTTLFNVYEINSDYSGWSVKYRVDLDGVMNAFPDSICSYLDPSDLNYYRFVILSLVRGENDEHSFLVLHVPGKAIRYNFGDMTFEKLCDLSPGRHDIAGSLTFDGWFDAFEYIDSLSCV